MAGNKSKKSDGNSNKNKQKYRPNNKAVKKGSYPLRPGVQGFFITCDGGRERQASQEAINVLDSFCEELVDGKASGVGPGQKIPDKPSNKKITFSYSDSSSSDDDNDREDVKKAKEEGKAKSGADAGNDASHENSSAPNSDVNEQGEKYDSSKKEASHDDDGGDDVKKVKEGEDKSGAGAGNDASQENSLAPNSDVNEQGEKSDSTKREASHDENQEVHEEEAPTKKQCLEDDVLKRQSVSSNKVEEVSVDRLIEAELRELGDKSKRRFIYLDSGCNGVVFVQMKKKDGDPSPTEIVQHMLTSIASTKRHVSRFILRLLPVEVSCYASEEDITRAIAPVISLHFPAETQTVHKFAVLYDARANTGVDKMKIINAVAKSVPAPHKVDLSNPDKNIVVQVVKTVCLIGVVEKYKELAKYNLRQLTSPPEEP